MQHPLEKFKYCPKCGSSKFIVNNFKSKKCEDCEFIYYFNPSAATVALIFNKEGELLVATRSHEPAKGTYDLPGGFVDLCESGEEAIKREVKEETNLDVIETQYLLSIANRYNYSDFEVHTLDLVYRCQVNTTENIKAEDDVAKLEFKKIEDLNPDDFGLLSIKEIIKIIQQKAKV